MYVARSPGLRLDRAVRVPGGFRRLVLRSGERRRVTVRVAARTLSSWDAGRRRWTLGTGTRTVWVGAPSGDLRLRTGARVSG